MNYKKYKILFGAVSLSMMLAGCSSTTKETESATIAAESTAKDSDTAQDSEQSSAENSFSYSDASKEAPVSESITGMVSSVEGNQITLTTGSPGGGGAPGGDGERPEMTGDGEQPEMPENGEATEPADGEQQETSADSGAPEMSEDGERPDDMGGGESAEAVLTIADESVITVAAGSEDGESGAETGSLADIEQGSMLIIDFDADGLITSITVSTGMGGSMGTPPEGDSPDGMGGQQSGVDSYAAVNEYQEDTTLTGETITSTGTDENAVLISEGANVTLRDVTIERTSSDSTGGDTSSFYGVGAAGLTINGNAYVSGGTITTEASGGAGLFAYDTGTIYAADTTIKTTQDTSGGIHAAGGGTFYAWDLNVETDGESAAAIRSDRGGGKMVVDGGTYVSNGIGSPSVYCTADIAVNNAELTATGSEAICMEGLNTLHFYDCDITGNMSEDERNDSIWTMIVYQSMSGDSEVGNSTMQIVGGSITSQNGGLLYTTNTESNILFSDVEITSSENNEYFLRCSGNDNQRGWGTTGANGSDCIFTADSQKMDGDVIWDSISKLDFYMTNASTLTGAVVDDETYAGNGGDGYCNVYISSDSQWVVTGDSTVTSLQNEGSITDEQGNPVSVVGTDGTVYVDGSSEYEITVTSYETSTDLSGAATAAEWSEYQTEKPAEL